MLRASDFDPAVLLIHYAANDERVNASCPPYEAAFAWRRTVEFSNRTLRG